MSGLLRRAPVTTAILAVITVVFIFEWVTGALWNDGALISMGAITRGMIARGELWRIVASMFLHGSVLHFAANAWALYQLGALYEAMFGHARFGLIYFTTGACAAIASSLTVQYASVGASGAVMGILGAFIVSIRRSPQWRHEPWTKSLLSQLIFWAGVNIVLGFSVEFIDNTAHIAGLVSGLILGLIPHRVPPPPPGTSVVDVHAYDESTLRQNQP